jgi:toxin ParE1/3/4
MSYQLFIKPLAEKDVIEIYAWYEEQNHGLGDEFLVEFESTMELVKSNPYQYQLRYKNVRMVKINRFPICIHLTIDDKKVFIHAVLSTYRNPKIWLRRK